ncbi:sodium:neurotransmitter symporter superfamily [Holotrichia oblita]|uniref:Sodium:neurotransmitter symporter superfamily n=1 Tax=Holotrichia oblita TaxID=644536 RepID=A0ACB9TDP0_HOLOL|nr:sodium:neurotransmitter symporter superfamily [Holotrichia oblita]
MIRIDPEKYIMIDEDEYTHRSMCSLSSISSLKENIHQSAMKDCAQLYNDDITKYHSNSYRQKELSDIEEEILKVIPTETNLQIKKSINEKLRVTKKLSQSSLNSLKNFSDVSFVRNEDDFLEDPQTGIKFKCVPQSTGRRIREQQSKLSVCIEDESESDIDILSQERNHPFHGPAKNSKVSPETIEVIMSELLFQLEERN